jgi:hypothetical protein
MAENFIKDQLKAPSTAEFSPHGETRVAYNEADDTYTVRGWVDAQNSFGAKLRSKYICTVRNTVGDRWQASPSGCSLTE